MSTRISNLALYNSFDRYFEIPFLRNSKKVRFHFKEVKVDDITFFCSSSSRSKILYLKFY